MKKILLINSMKKFGHSQGQLNTTLHKVAVETLTKLGFETKETVVDDGYDIEEELNKFLWANIVVYQMPGWWMGAPWILKKYIDEVFTAGHGTLYESDGRSRKDESKKYGSGGLVHDKKYMLSLTWNAPQVAFTDKKQFFEGLGVDAVYFPFHKAHEFLGMQKLATFICNDVMKDPNIDKYISNYKSHLKKLF